MYKRGLIITFFAVAILAFILEFFFSSSTILLILDLVLLIFSLLTLIWSIFAIKNQDKTLGITLLIISSLLVILWIIGFLIALIG